MICFSFFVAALIFLHTLLATKSLSSWEYFSWMKITYLKVWPKKYGSPFSKGSKTANFKSFCSNPFGSRTYAYPWRMPTKLPKLEE